MIQEITKPSRHLCFSWSSPPAAPDLEIRIRRVGSGYCWGVLESDGGSGTIVTGVGDRYGHPSPRSVEDCLLAASRAYWDVLRQKRERWHNLEIRVAKAPPVEETLGGRRRAPLTLAQANLARWVYLWALVKDIGTTSLGDRILTGTGKDGNDPCETLELACTAAREAFEICSFERGA